MRSFPQVLLVPVVVVLSVLATGCARVYAVPATLSAPSLPAVSLYDGVGDGSVTGSLTTVSLDGRVALSPAPHLGVHLRGALPRPRLASEQTSLRTVEQSEVGVGATVYGPTEGALRTELTIDVGTGRVSGFGADSVSSASCLFCFAEPISDLYRVEAIRTRQSGAVTLAGDWDAFGLGATVGLSRVTVSEVQRVGGGPLPGATGTVLDHAVFVQSRQGVGTLRLWAGGSLTLGESADAGPDGVVRGLGGTYRTSAVPYLGVEVGIDLGGLLRPATGD